MSWRRGGRRLLLSLALAAALAPLAGLGARPAHAAGDQTYVVTTAGDPASCPDASGLSLRCAVALAQANGGQDTITFNLPKGSIIPLLRTLVINELSGSLTIQGPGARALTLEGFNLVQDLSVLGTVTLANLTVADGVAQGQAGFTGNGGGGGGGAAGLGGGLIVNGGNVTVAGVTFAGNSAVGGAGGLSLPNTGGFGGSGGGPLGGSGGIGVPIGPGGTPGFTGGFASGGGGGGNSGGDPLLGPLPIMFPGGAGAPGGFGGGSGGGGGLAGPSLPGDSVFGGIGGTGLANGGGGGGGGAGLGGAIFVQQGALTVTGSTFRGNSATGGAGGAPGGGGGVGLGGAIFAYQGSVTVDICTTFADGADSTFYFQAASVLNAPCTTSTQLTSSATTSTYGQALTLTAQVAVVGSGSPTGSVTFYDNGASLGAAPLDGGTASLSTSSLGAGTHSLTAVYGGDPLSRGSSSAALSQQVNPAPLTVTANNQTTTYGGSVPTFDASENGFVNGDTASVVSGLVCGASDASSNPVSSNTPAGSYTITCSGGSAANYTLSYVPGTLTINPAALTITANDKSMTYGGTLPAFDASYSGFVNGDSAASLSTAPACGASATSSSPVGSDPITCSGAVDPNYTISYDGGTLTINPAPLTITASSPSVTYNGSVPAITPTYSGFVNGDNAASLSTAPTCASTAPASGAAGSYQTACSGAVDPNYSISYVPGTLTINQVAQSISFAPLPNHLLGDAPFTVAAPGGGSANPVTFSAGPSSVCTAGGANGAVITLVGVGTCTVTANQAGDANYLPASSVAQSFSVSYPPLFLALGVSSSPAGPITTGSTVTASLTLGNHTTASQTVKLAVTLAYQSSQGYLSITVPLRLQLTAGQTLSKSVSFPIYAWFPRGAYTLNATATDGSGDTASNSAAFTVS